MEAQTQSGQVKPKLRMPHPSIEAARKFREEWQNEQHTQPAPTPSEPVVPPSPPLPEPPVPSPEPVAATPQVTPAPQPQPQYVPPSQMTVPDSYYMDKDATRVDYRQLTDERDALKKQLEETRQAMQAMQEEAAKYRAMEEDRFIDNYIDREGDAFVSIDREDARRLLKPVYQTVRDEMGKRVQQSEARMQEIADSVQKRLDEMQQREEMDRLTRARNAVLKAHPDLAELQNTDAYRRVMLTPVGGNPNLLLGNVVATEFQKGNVEYVNQVLDQIRAEAGRNKPQSLDSIASVSGSGTATTPAAPSDDGEMSLDQLEQMKIDVQTGKMTRKEFREAMQKYRGASATQKP